MLRRALAFGSVEQRKDARAKSGRRTIFAAPDHFAGPDHWGGSIYRVGAPPREGLAYSSPAGGVSYLVPDLGAASKVHAPVLTELSEMGLRERAAGSGTSLTVASTRSATETPPQVASATSIDLLLAQGEPAYCNAREPQVHAHVRVLLFAGSGPGGSATGLSADVSRHSSGRLQSASMPSRFGGSPEDSWQPAEARRVG